MNGIYELILVYWVVVAGFEAQSTILGLDFSFVRIVLSLVYPHDNQVKMYISRSRLSLIVQLCFMSLCLKGAITVGGVYATVRRTMAQVNLRRWLKSWLEKAEVADGFAKWLRGWECTVLIL